jgi:hypothetical protein
MTTQNGKPGFPDADDRQILHKGGVCMERASPQNTDHFRQMIKLKKGFSSKYNLQGGVS